MKRTIQFDDFEASDQNSKEDGRAENNDSVGLSDEAEELSLHLGSSSNSREVATCVFDKSAKKEDRGQDVIPGERTSLAPRAILNVETPMANRL